MQKYPFFIILCLLALSCSGGGDKSRKAGKAFPYPQVPEVMLSQEGAAGYVLTHFWNGYFAGGCSCDTLVLEEAFSQYVSLLISAPLELIQPAQDSLLFMAERAQKDGNGGRIFDTMLSLEEKYLFDANSPYRNEECYIPVLQKIIASPLADAAAKRRAERYLPLVSLNRLGTVANDFTYTLRNGRTGRMHEIKAERLIMFFSNPGCTSCKEIIDALKASAKVDEMMKKGTLKVLNVYPDSDLGEWYRYMSHYPQEWINCFEEELTIHDDKSYYLRAIPSLYLLDEDKRVICKDAPTELVLSKL